MCQECSRNQKKQLLAWDRSVLRNIHEKLLIASNGFFLLERPGLLSFAQPLAFACNRTPKLGSFARNKTSWRPISRPPFFSPCFCVIAHRLCFIYLSYEWNTLFFYTSRRRYPFKNDRHRQRAILLPIFIRRPFFLHFFV